MSVGSDQIPNIQFQLKPEKRKLASFQALLDRNEL
jgi:hypothetical protein